MRVMVRTGLNMGACGVEAVGLRAGARGRRRGFTLIEIMVVIAIIIILVGITVAVGVGVRSRAAHRATLTTLKSLDGLMTDYLKADNPDVTATDTASPGVGLPAADSKLYLIALRSVAAKNAQGLSSLTLSPAGDQVVDAYGTPVLYVPASQTQDKRGYFWSAGPDRFFGTNSNGTTDDIRSTDAN